jgi:hypothetical protein
MLKIEPMQLCILVKHKIHPAFLSIRCTRRSLLGTVPTGQPDQAQRDEKRFPAGGTTFADPRAYASEKALIRFPSSVNVGKTQFSPQV